MKTSWKRVAASLGATVLSYALAAPQFLLLISICIDLRKVVHGLAAWSGMAALIPVGIGFLAFVIAVPDYFWNGAVKGRLRIRLLRVLSVQCLLYPLLHFLRAFEFSFRIVSWQDYAFGGAGLLSGILFAVLARRPRPAAPA